MQPIKIICTKFKLIQYFLILFEDCLEYQRKEQEFLEALLLRQ